MKKILSFYLLLTTLLFSQTVFAIIIATDGDAIKAEINISNAKDAVDNAQAKAQAAKNKAKDSIDQAVIKASIDAERELKQAEAQLQKAQAELEEVKSRTRDALKEKVQKEDADAKAKQAQAEEDRKKAEEEKRLEEEKKKKAQEKQDEEKPQTKEDDRLKDFKTKVNVDANEFLKPAFDAKTRGQDYVKTFATLKAANPSGNLYVTVNGLKIKGVTECQEQGSMVVITYKKGQSSQQKVVKMEEIQDVGVAQSSLMITTE